MRERAVAILVILMSMPACAGFVTGNELNNQCKTSQQLPFQSGIVLGYIEGVYDLSRILPDKDIGLGCVPPAVTAGQFKDVVCSYLDRHPENRHYPGSALVAIAIGEAWSCSQQSPAQPGRQGQ